MGIFKDSGIYKGPGIYKTGAEGGGGGGGGGSSVNIGGVEYSTTQIGSLIWTTENLFSIFPGFIFYNSPNIGDKFFCSKNNETNLIFYSYQAMRDINDNFLPDGWRIPTIDDFNYLRSVETLESCKSLDTWTTPGTNESGFNMKNLGGYFAGGWYNTNGSDLWAADTNKQNLIRFTNDSWQMISWGFDFSVLNCIRLCKDA